MSAGEALAVGARPPSEWTEVRLSVTLELCAALFVLPSFSPDPSIASSWPEVCHVPAAQLDGERANRLRTVACRRQPAGEQRESQRRLSLPRSLEGRILAVSSTSTTSLPTLPGAPKRVSFAKLREPLEVPNLLALQTESFDWLIGGPGVAGAAGRPRHRQRPGRDPGRDLADRGFLRRAQPVLLRPAFRRGQGDRGGVPGQGHDLLGAALRHRRVRQRRDRRDQVPDRLHG